MPEIGDVLAGRYRLLKTLGRGGMADVYRARDDERGVEVAIKVMREDYAEEPEFIKRFTKEAQALAKLDHPNIVRFYSFEQDGRTAFIVMDYVRGDTLRGRLRDAGGPLPLGEVTQVLRQVGAALHFAHRRGYLHRDIKPANIMLREDGTALLSDFGIARAAEATTITHSAAGTPAYMSPEQILGEELSYRTDIYYPDC
jgi:serine/threonine-protein kinase